MSAASMYQCADHALPLFAALSDPTRLQLVRRLSLNGPQSISELAEGATVSRQAVTKHLVALEKADLATSRQQGRERIFELQPQKLAVAHRYLEQISRQWEQALTRLQAHVEN